MDIQQIKSIAEILWVLLMLVFILHSIWKIIETRIELIVLKEFTKRDKKHLESAREFAKDLEGMHEKLQKDRKEAFDKMIKEEDENH